MARTSNWPSLLHAFIDEKRKVPFEWSKNDCATFAADWVAILTGVDHAANLRGTYSSALGAARILDAAGGLEGIVARTGFKEVGPTYAQRGDLVVFDDENGPTLGVCIGKHSAFAHADGVAFRLTLECRRAWRTE